MGRLRNLGPNLNIYISIWQWSTCPVKFVFINNDPNGGFCKLQDCKRVHFNLFLVLFLAFIYLYRSSWKSVIIPEPSLRADPSWKRPLIGLAKQTPGLTNIITYTCVRTNPWTHTNTHHRVTVIYRLGKPRYVHSTYQNTPGSGVDISRFTPAPRIALCE